MKLNFKPNGCSVCLLVLAILSLIVSLFLWIAFPFVYKAIVHSQLVLAHEDSGRPTETTWMWYKPPVNNVMNFYMYNVTNAERIIYFGEKPQIVEVGPFAVVESEAKNEYEFRDDNTKLWYKNYKTYVYNETLSCPVCKYDSIVGIANLPALGAIGELQDPKYNVSKSAQGLLNLVLLLMGEFPFVYTKFGEVMFDGYNDALLSAAHSDLIKGLDDLCNCSIIPVPVPAMEKLALFYQYNNTNDNEYVINTGKDDINQYGKIVSWAGTNMLPEDWWSTKEARMINGSDTGSFQPPGLNASSVNYFFQSFLCRSFYMTYKDDNTVHDIPTYEFQTPYATFDTTIKENIGFRYANREKVNYFPDWPCGPNHKQENCTEFIDCSVYENFCHKCCDGAHVNGTYVLPPGMYYTACYPGKFEQSPFYLIFSAPHFAFSPSDVYDSVVGQHPKIPDHVPFIYNHEKISSAISKIDFRFQVNIPMYKSSHAIMANHFPNKILPVLWVQAEAYLEDWAYDTMHLAFVLVPKLVDMMKIFTLVIALLLSAIAVMCSRKSKKEDLNLRESRMNLIAKKEIESDMNAWKL